MKGAAPRKRREVEFLPAEDAQLNGLGVGPQLGGGQAVEEGTPVLGTDAVDVLDRAERAVGALRQAAGEEIRAGEKIREIHLPVAGFLLIGGSDAAPGRAAGLLRQDVHPIVFLGQIEQAVGQVGQHRPLVDQEVGERMA